MPGRLKVCERTGRLGAIAAAREHRKSLARLQLALSIGFNLPLRRSKNNTQNYKTLMFPFALSLVFSSARIRRLVIRGSACTKCRSRHKKSNQVEAVRVARSRFASLSLSPHFGAIGHPIAVAAAVAAETIESIVGRAPASEKKQENSISIRGIKRRARFYLALASRARQLMRSEFGESRLSSFASRPMNNCIHYGVGHVRLHFCGLFLPLQRIPSPPPSPLASALLFVCTRFAFPIWQLLCPRLERDYCVGRSQAARRSLDRFGQMRVSVSSRAPFLEASNASARL